MRSRMPGWRRRPCDQLSPNPRDGSRVVVVAEGANPNVAEADGIPVLLELEDDLRRMRLQIGAKCLVRDAVYSVRGAKILPPIVEDDAVLDDGDSGLLRENALRTPEGRLE